MYVVGTHKTRLVGAILILLINKHLSREIHKTITKIITKCTPYLVNLSESIVLFMSARTRLISDIDASANRTVSCVKR